MSSLFFVFFEKICERRGGGAPPVWGGAAPCVRRFPFVRLCRPAEGGTESGLHKILRSFPVFY